MFLFCLKRGIILNFLSTYFSHFIERRAIKANYLRNKYVYNSMPYCQNCGAEVQLDWSACPKCGNRLKETPITLTSPPPIVNITNKSRESNTYGVESLVFGILGLFLMPIIGPILAIAFGIKGKERDDKPSYAKAGFVLGIIGIFEWSILAIIIILSILGIFGLFGLFS